MKVTFTTIDKNKKESEWVLDSNDIGISTTIADSEYGLWLTNIKFEEDESVPLDAMVSQAAPQPGAVAEGLQEKLTTKKYYKDGWEDAIKVVLFALSEFEIYEDSEIYQQIKCLKS